jgi:(heptosyl)LPS beta-1,4-glucosyltransferase
MEEMKISVVVNTFNEEKNLERALKSVQDFADEIVVVDMHSTDRTVQIAKKFKAKVFLHEYTRFVEPARNFALRQAQGDWILILDADEELPASLAKTLIETAKAGEADWVELPRKNMIFSQWIKNSRWWPDFLPRFFKKGKVSIPAKIHAPYEKEGQGIRLPAEEENALVHHHYESISQYLERLNRYTDIQAEELKEKGYLFCWQDLMIKPANEFFSRFFAGEGYKDGLHGLVLALLQAFSELVLYLKIWEKGGFTKENINSLTEVMEKIMRDYLYWQQKVTANAFAKIRLKIKSKI